MSKMLGFTVSPEATLISKPSRMPTNVDDRSGQVLGWEISRDETRLLLLAEAGVSGEVDERLREYEIRWLPTSAAGRASVFLGKFKSRFCVSSEVDHSQT